MPRPTAEQTVDAMIAKIRRDSTRTHRMYDYLHKAAAENDGPEPPSPPPLPILEPLLHISYYPDDGFGFVAACASVLPLMAVIAVCAWVVARRELHAIWLLCCAFLHVAAALRIGAASALPVSCTAFLLSHGLLFLWRDAWIVHALLWKPLATALSIGLLAAVAAAHVHLGDERAREELVGGIILGIAMGKTSYIVYQLVRPTLRTFVHESACCQYFYVHDCKNLSDVLRSDYEYHRAMDREEREKRWV